MNIGDYTTCVTPPLLIPPLLALTASVIAHALALKLFPRIGLLDFPERYGLTRARIPYPAGVVSVGLFVGLSPWILASWSDKQAIGLLAGVILLSLVCFRDDIRRLPPWTRAGIQLLIALILFSTGTRIYSLTNPLDAFMPNVPYIPLDQWTLTVPWLGTLPLLSGVFTIVWIGLTVNALNWFDGITGQVSLLAVIGFLTIGFLSIQNGFDGTQDPALRAAQGQVALLSFVLAGIAAGAAVFDFPPGKMLLGDTGAMFFGLMLGVVTIYAGGKVATAFLVLGVPLVDSILVGMQRLASGKSIAQGSMGGEHLHHLLLANGWSKRGVVLLTAGLGTAFGLTALFLNTEGKAIAAAVLVIVMVTIRSFARRHSIAVTSAPPRS